MIFQGLGHMTGNGDIETQRATYHRLLGLMKYGAVACFLIAFGVVWLIAG